jgi:uncharacterized protein YndB with AHSA1/START domain
VPAYAVSTEIGASPTEVFDYIADLTRHGEWAVDPLEIRLVEGDGGVGSRYQSAARSKGKTIPAEIRITASDRPKRLGFEVSDLTGSYAHEFTLEPSGAGTRVERRITTSHLSPAQLLLFWVVYPTVKRPNARRAMENLRARLMSEAPAPR